MAKVRFLHRPQSYRNSIRNQRPGSSFLWLLSDDVDALAAGVSRNGVAGDRAGDQSSARRRRYARRQDGARFLQFVRRDARHDHDLPRHRAGGLRRLWKFRRPAADRRAGHDLPEDQHGELLGVLRRRRHHARQLFCSGRRGQGRLDFLHAARRHRRQRSGLSLVLERPKSLADRIRFPDHFIAARRGQFHHHDHSTARQRPDLDAAAVFRLGAIRHRIPFAAGVSAARSRRHHATNGSHGGDQLLHADAAWW